MVSVIVPTHNRSTLLPRAVASVMAQQLEDWELILVDDGSDDATPEYLRTLEKTWPLTNSLRILRQSNHGVSHARNRGAEVARGEWLAFLDSDDEWLPGKLSAQMELSERFAWIHGEEIWRRNGRDVPTPEKYRKQGGWIFERCAEICCVSTSTTMIRRDVFAGFREDFPVCEDFELWLRLAARFEVGWIGEPVTIKHGGHADQLSRRHHSMDYYRVKALIPFLNGPARDHVAAILREKCEILLAGYRKYQRDAREIEEWQSLLS